MPTIIRKTSPVLTDLRREILQAVSWQVRSNIWSPPTDVYENEDDLVARIEIAGMREEDFEVTVQDDVLLITGYRPDYSERRAYHQMEIRFGKFATAIGLPGPVDVDNAHAEYKDGFLTVILPKVKKSEVKVES